jgi:MFS family permease
VFVEPRLREPLIDLSLFANRSYLGANAVTFAQNFGFGAVMFFLTLYLQYVLDYSPLKAGLVFLPFTVLFTKGNLQAGRLASAIGPRLSVAGGMALIAAAFLLLALVTPTSGLAIVVVALVIAGVGQSLAYTISTTAGMGAISAAEAGLHRVYCRWYGSWVSSSALRCLVHCSRRLRTASLPSCLQQPAPGSTLRIVRRSGGCYWDRRRPRGRWPS